MIASTNSTAGCYLIGQNLCLKSCASYGFQSMPDLNRVKQFVGDLLLASLNTNNTIRSACRKLRAMDATKEPFVHEQDNVFYDSVQKLPESLRWLLESEDADKLALLNKKKKRQSTNDAQVGVILEWQGVVVEDDDPELEPRVWYLLSLEEEKYYPPDAVLKEIEGMKTEEAIGEVLHWSDDLEEVQRLAARKEEIYQALRGDYYCLRPGALDFMNTLVHYEIPTAVASAVPKKSLEKAISVVGLHGFFDATVAAEDVSSGKPEPEMFELAAKLLGLNSDRCVVCGNSNLTTESAHRAGMRCVAVASRRPAYELRTADHVVRWLDQLSFLDLQMLASGEAIGRRARAADMEIIIEE